MLDLSLMTNKELAALLHHVAVSYSIKDEGKYRFQIMAYNKASEVIQSMTTPVESLFLEGKTEGILGVGPSIREHLEELFKTGKSSHFNRLLGELPPAMFPLLDVSGFGPKKAYKIVTHFHLSNPETVIDDVNKLAQKGEIAKLETFGEKSQEIILRAIAEHRLGKTKSSRMSYPFANSLAEQIITYLKSSPEVIEVYPLGSLRRKKDTIGDIDLAVTTYNDQAVIEHFISYPYLERLLQKGKNEANFLTAGGKRVDLRTQPVDSFGSLLQHFTGSKNHNVHLREHALKMNLSLSEYGIKNLKSDKKNTLSKYATEQELYKALGMQWIPPEMREDLGEIELAAEHKLPVLVKIEDLKGDFHLHSNFPIEPSHDLGQDSFQSMLDKSKKLNYQYLGFSEHNPSVSKHTAEQINKILIKRNKIIDQLSLNNKSIRIFSLLECDILANGDLALSNSNLSLLDGLLVSIHSSFSLDKSKMTKRILSGLANHKAKIFAHPTTRLINERRAIDADWQEIFHFCAENNKALEINSSPNRLDLPDDLVRLAGKIGVKFFINTDAHSTSGMDLMQYGVSVARRGWLTKKDIINCWDYQEVLNWFKI